MSRLTALALVLALTQPVWADEDWDKQFSEDWAVVQKMDQQTMKNGALLCFPAWQIAQEAHEEQEKNVPVKDRLYTFEERGLALDFLNDPRNRCIALMITMKSSWLRVMKQLKDDPDL